jgi:type III secretory pathway component EscS
MKDKDLEMVDITGELLAEDSQADLVANEDNLTVVRKAQPVGQSLAVRYILVPVLLLTVAALGGLRLAGADSSFIFLKPALLCLIFASIMLALFFRSGLLQLDGWLSDDFPLLKNAINVGVLIALFAATTQIFNSLIPEQGVPLWIVGFCFFWTLWNNLFANFDTKRLLRSLGGLFGLAFVIKYLVLANLTALTGDGWLRGILENPTQEAFTWLLDLPRFTAGTGYIQFFGAALYLMALFLLPASTRNEKVL